MRYFNAFQLVCLFLGLPLLIQYLHTAEFWGATAAQVVAILTFVGLFIMSVGSYADTLKNF